jgi:hypothetical protein
MTMTSDLSRWLPAIDPPAGGAARLRRALDDAERAQARPFGFVLAGASAGLLAVCLSLWATPESSSQAELRQRVAEALVVPPTTVRVRDGDVLARESPRADVSVYWVVTRADAGDQSAMSRP